MFSGMKTRIMVSREVGCTFRNSLRLSVILVWQNVLLQVLVF